jgi:hypothetical protein
MKKLINWLNKKTGAYDTFIIVGFTASLILVIVLIEYFLLGGDL